MPRVIASSQNRSPYSGQALFTASGFVSNSGGANTDQGSPANCRLLLDGLLLQGTSRVELVSFSIPNTFDDYDAVFQFEEQAAPGVRSIPLAGWQSFSGFAAQLQAALNAAGTLAYTVTYTDLPAGPSGLATSDQLTISATGNFRLHFTNEAPPNTNWTQSVARMLGLQLASYAPSYITPYAASISSVVPAILSSHRELMIQIEQLPSNGSSFGPPVSSFGRSQAVTAPFTFLCQVDKAKRDILFFAPNKSHRQVLELNDHGFQGFWDLRVLIRGVDGQAIGRIPDWVMVLDVE